MTKPLMEWMKDGGYLPAFMRDFHDQKDLFKTVFEWVENRKRAEPGSAYHFEGLTWVNTQIFVIDFFLWFMALHGYTLQKTRKKYDYRNLDATIQDRRSRDEEHFASLLKSHLAASKADT